MSNRPNRHADSYHDRSLSLAALLCSAAMVERTAQGARPPGELVDYLLTPVLARNSDSVRQLLPPNSMRLQLLAEAKKLIRGDTQSVTVLGYVVELIGLAKRLGNHPQAAADLGRQLDTLTQPDTERLAQIYQNSISKLGRRIQVQGDSQALQSEAVAAQVRALLLAGIRFAWLWHQLGGRRWHLVTQRGRTLAALTELEREPIV